MILPPTENDVARLLTWCVMHGEVRDVRKLNMAHAENEADAARRRYQRNAKRRSRARGKK